jgi:hypothetical protein
VGRVVVYPGRQFSIVGVRMPKQSRKPSKAYQRLQQSLLQRAFESNGSTSQSSQPHKSSDSEENIYDLNDRKMKNKQNKQKATNSYDNNVDISMDAGNKRIKRSKNDDGLSLSAGAHQPIAGTQQDNAEDSSNSAEDPQYNDQGKDLEIEEPDNSSETFPLGPEDVDVSLAPEDGDDIDKPYDELISGHVAEPLVGPSVPLRKTVKLKPRIVVPTTIPDKLTSSFDFFAKHYAE